MMSSVKDEHVTCYC